MSVRQRPNHHSTDGDGGGEQQQQDSQPQQHPQRWGKRLRDSADQVRFSDLTPEQKMQRRRQERQEKKDRERTLAYFTSAQRIMEEHAQSSDPTVLASMVDGFFGELIKRLKADPSFHLLRNGVVCRTVEVALGSASLLQAKTLLYVFLSRVMDLVTSPVASYTFETLLVRLTLGLSALSESNDDGFQMEMAEGGPGMHTGSGVPSTATLLRSMVDELTEKAEDLLMHEVGSRALRSILLALGGYSIHNAPMPASPVAHEALLGVLAGALITALEDGYGREYQTRTAAESWLAAAQVPTTSFVVQGLLRVSVEGNPCYATVVGRMEELLHKNKPLLWHLMADQHLGSHLFQAYLRVPVPSRLVELGATEAIQLDMRLARPAQRRQRDAAAVPGAAEKPKEPAREGKAVEEEEELLRCCWGRGLRMVQSSFSLLISRQQLPYILQDLALGAPTAAHLYLLWDQLFAKHLSALLSGPGSAAAGAAALTALVRKCAFAASERVEAQDANTGMNSVPADLNSVLRADESQGVRYFSFPAQLQTLVCRQLCSALAERDGNGSASRYLLVDGDMGDRGMDLARCLLHLHPSSSRPLQQGMDDLTPDHLYALAEHRKGSLVLQQYLKVASYRIATGREAVGTAGGGPDAVSGAETALRFLRKVEGQIYALVYSKYGAFVVETLYEVGSVAVKEAVVEALIPVYSSLKDQPEAADREESLRSHVAGKVLAKCCVELFIHRRSDWQRMAQRQEQVQRLSWRMMLEG